MLGIEHGGVARVYAEEGRVELVDFFEWCCCTYVGWIVDRGEGFVGC